MRFRINQFIKFSFQNTFILIKQFYLWSLLRYMKYPTNDFMTRARTHTHTKLKFRTNIFNHLHDPLCSPYDSLYFIHLLISSNLLTTLKLTKQMYLTLKVAQSFYHVCTQQSHDINVRITHPSTSTSSLGT